MVSLDLSSLTMGSSSPDLSIQQKIPSLLDDCGVYVGNMMIIYPKHHKLLIKEKIVDLTPIEFKLMLLLTENIDNPLDSEKIYDSLWNDSDLMVTSFTLKTHISNLRQKLKRASGGSVSIIHVKGKGYSLVIPKF